MSINSQNGNTPLTSGSFPPARAAPPSARFAGQCIGAWPLVTMTVIKDALDPQKQSGSDHGMAFAASNE
jgi:hypothetical protein